MGTLKRSPLPPFLLLFLIGRANLALASPVYACKSAETDPNLSFQATVTERADHRSADIVLVFPKGNPPVTRYDNVPYDAADSSADSVAFGTEGIVVVVYPDPSRLSTILIGDAGATQAGFAMHCQALLSATAERRG